MNWRRSNRRNTKHTPVEGDVRRQILIDISVIYQHDARTGIQRVVRAVWTLLLQMTLVDDVVRPVFATKKHPYVYARPDFLGLPECDNDADLIPVEVKPRDIFLGLDLSAHVFPQWENQVAGWQAQGVKIYMLMYDLLPLMHPKWFQRKTVKHFQKWMRAVLRRADAVICISEEVRKEFSNYRHDNETSSSRHIRLHKIRLGADIANSLPNTGTHPDAESILESMGSHHFALMVGTVEPRKAHKEAILAFEFLWRQRDASSTHLIIIGKAGWKTRSLQKYIRQHPEFGRRLFWFADVSDEFLCDLYEAATFLLMASHAEGYGLPVIEARYKGLPILARDIPVFREVAGPYAAFFRDDRPAALADRIAAITAQPPSSGHSGSAETVPSWSDTVDDLISLLDLSTGESATATKEMMRQ